MYSKTGFRTEKDIQIRNGIQWIAALIVMLWLAMASVGCSSGSGMSAAAATTTLSLTASPSSLVLPVGSSASGSVLVEGQSQSVNLSVSGLPAGVTATFGSPSASGAVPLALSASNSAPAGDYSVEVQGASGGQVASTKLTLTLTNPTFSLSASASSLALVSGGSATSTITLVGANGFSGSATLAVSGLPAGITASFSPSTISTTSLVTFTAGATTAPGSYSGKVTATSNGVSASTSIALTVSSPTSPSFSLSTSPTSVALQPGSTISSTISVLSQGGFNGNVNLAISGLPSGITASLSQASTSSSSVVTFTASNAVVSGNYTVQVSASSGTLSASSIIQLTVSVPSFSLVSSPNSLSVTVGSSVPASVSIVGAAGFSAPVTLGVSGMPAGVTATFSPATTASNSTVSFTASSVAAPGTYSATIVGTSGSLTTTAPITLIIPTPSFSLSSSLTTLSFAQGTSAPTTISVTGANGFSSSVSLAVSGLPSGMTGVFSPATTSSTSTLTFTATSLVTAGNYTATITGTSSAFGTTIASTTVAITITNAPSGPGTTWYVRTDGGSRYDLNVPDGQCDGKSDAPYPGSGVNQHCAFNDFRYLYDDGTYGNFAWVISGGDTVVVEGCAAAPDQQNPDAPHCRIGWDTSTGSGSLGWCAGSEANFGCYNPTIPAGTASQHTRILGACAVSGTCNSGNATVRTNLAQLFGGFGTFGVLNLGGTQYVDVQGIEFTTHNGKCVHYGAPAYPKTCSASSPADDYADQGIVTNTSTANILLEDVYIDGMAASGLAGPIGGPITMKRVNVSFNGFAGWNFDNGFDTPDAPGSSINASYVTMIGNGCNQEYPIVHTAFPAFACYDSSSGGFGDSWSGQDTELDSFTCDHCVNNYNTKDAFIGPHTQIKNLTITNSESIGNMGQSWKWGTYPGGTLIFENNLTVGNCFRMSQALPGAAQNFNQSTGLPGSHLSNYCRAAGMVFGVIAAANSNWTVAGNSIITYQPTIFDINCQTSGACGTTSLNFTDNLILGYTTAANYYPGASGTAPGMYYFEDTSIPHPVTSYTVEYGTRNDDCGSGSAHIICSDPLLVNEPAQGSIPPEMLLDNFNFHPNSYSPAVSTGLPISGLTSDFYGVTRPSAPTLGAVEP